MRRATVSSTRSPVQDTAPSKPGSNSPYITEIDGIRALAVIPIVLFHFGISGFPGGFVGVDVFFVISGYLITRNIRKENEQGNFRLLQFYGRRIRRLFPAMLAVVILTSLASILVLAPPHLEQYGASIPWVLASAVNIHFYNEIGYFDSASFFKPLLHYWSLAVEEQFYLVWPALLLFCSSRFRKPALMGLLVAIALVSLLASEYMIERDAAAAFYLMPLRAWEFAIGAVCAIAPAPRPQTRLGRLMALVGFVMIAMTLVLYSEHQRFPGVAALPPCLGTALLIRYAQGSLVGPLLRSFPMVHVGKISYSLYLVHWPLAVLYPYWTGRPLTSFDRVMLGVLSIVLAEVLFRYVENRFRRPHAQTDAVLCKTRISVSSFTVGILASSSFALVFAAVLLKTDGLPGRIANTKTIEQLENRYDGCLNAKPRAQTGLDCKLGSSDAPVKVLLIGDSHAAHFVPTWLRLTEQHAYHVTVNTHPACPPLVGTGMLYGGKGDRSLEESCFKRVEHWEQLIASGDFDVVAIAARWSLFFEDVEYAGKSLDRLYLVDRSEREPDQDRAQQLFAERLSATADAIANTGARSVVLSQVPVLGRNLQYCDQAPFLAADSPRLQTRCSGLVDSKIVQARLAQTDMMIERLNERPDVLGILMTDRFCLPDIQCTTINEKGLSLYKDDNHLSVAGSLFVASFVAPLIADFIGETRSDDILSESPAFQ